MAKVTILKESKVPVEVSIPSFRKKIDVNGTSYHAFFSEKSNDNITIHFGRDNDFQAVVHFSPINSILDYEEIEEDEFVVAYMTVSNAVRKTLEFFTNPEIKIVSDSVLKGLNEWNNAQKEPCATSED